MEFTKTEEETLLMGYYKRQPTSSELSLFDLGKKITLLTLSITWFINGYEKNYDLIYNDLLNNKELSGIMYLSDDSIDYSTWVKRDYILFSFGCLNDLEKLS